MHLSSDLDFDPGVLREKYRAEVVVVGGGFGGLDGRADGTLVVAETGARRMLAVDPATGERRVVASELPAGGVAREQPALFTHGLPGVLRPFAGLAAADGALLLAADGAVLRLS